MNVLLRNVFKEIAAVLECLYDLQTESELQLVVLYDSFIVSLTLRRHHQSLLV